MESGLIAVVVLLVRNWDRVSSDVSLVEQDNGLDYGAPGLGKRTSGGFYACHWHPLLIAENWDTIKAIAGNIFSQTVEIIRTIIFACPAIWDVMMGVVEKIRSAGYGLDAAKSVFGLFTRGQKKG